MPWRQGDWWTVAFSGFVGVLELNRVVLEPQLAPIGSGCESWLHGCSSSISADHIFQVLMVFSSTVEDFTMFHL